MGPYFALSEQFHTQAEPSFCGLASLVMVLNALAVDPKRAWKGVWRWYSEELLECCEPLEIVKTKGVTMDKLACTARCNSLEVTLQRDVDEDQLRRVVERIASQNPVNGGVSELVIASYSRKSLGQTGDGHFSPIAGFHKPSDSVLVLDTARFKYPPHWIPLSRLATAMRLGDKATNKSRGYLALKRRTTTDDQPFRLPVFHVRFIDPHHTAFLAWKATRPVYPTTLEETLHKKTTLHHAENDVQEALQRLDDLVATGTLPRAELFVDANDWCCCETQPPMDEVRTLLKQAAVDLGIDVISLRGLNRDQAVATLFAVPHTFWVTLLDEPTNVTDMVSRINAVIPVPLQAHVGDLREKFTTFLNYELGPMPTPL